MTKLEEEKKRKKAVAELEEEIDVLGQESEVRAAKWVKEKGKEADKEKERQVGDTLELLEKKNRFKIADYYASLADVMFQVAGKEDFPKEWMWRVVIQDEGIIFYLLSPKSRLFYRAIKPSHNPTYDFVAIDKIMESAWDAINKVKEEENASLLGANGKQVS